MNSAVVAVVVLIFYFLGFKFYSKFLSLKIFQISVGDLHMARGNLPAEINKILKKYDLQRKIRVIYENSESIYWNLAEKGKEEKADVVKLRSDAFCVMNVPPWVKLQSHINWLEQSAELHLPEEGEWSDEERLPIYVDYADQVHAYVQTIANYLDIDESGLDHFTVYTMGDFSFIEAVEKGGKYSKKEFERLSRRLEATPSYFISKENIIYLSDLSMSRAAEEAAKFIYGKCSDYPGLGKTSETRFFQTIYIEALGFFGSKLLNHKRKCEQTREFKLLLKRNHGKKLSNVGKDRREVAKQVIYFKEMEKSVERGGEFPRNLPATLKKDGKIAFKVAKALGYMIGERLYIALIENRISRADIKDLFYYKLENLHDAAKGVEGLLQRIKGIKSKYRGKIDHL